MDLFRPFCPNSPPCYANLMSRIGICVSHIKRVRFFHPPQTPRSRPWGRDRSHSECTHEANTGQANACLGPASGTQEKPFCAQLLHGLFLVCIQLWTSEKWAILAAKKHSILDASSPRLLTTSCLPACLLHHAHALFLSQMTSGTHAREAQAGQHLLSACCALGSKAEGVGQDLSGKCVLLLGTRTGQTKGIGTARDHIYWGACVRVLRENPGRGCFPPAWEGNK